LELLSLDDNAHWTRDVAFSPDGNCMASACYDGIVRVWHAGVQNDEWTTTREAAAMLRFAAEKVADRKDLRSVIERDRSVSETVRRTALRQATDGLLCEAADLAGHRAARRQDWTTAIAMFDRAARIDPHDAMHWYWLAMASLAAGDQATYRRACDALIDSESIKRQSDAEFFRAKKALLLRPRTTEELARLKPRFDDLIQRGSMPLHEILLLRMRSDETSLAVADMPADLGIQPEDQYVMALAWSRRGDAARAVEAYEAGMRQGRLGGFTWDCSVAREALRRETARLLGLDPSVR
jgi:hypothetical protein